MLETFIKARLIDFLLAREDITTTNILVGSEIFFADGNRRADLITLKEYLSAYEIKSSRDNLTKLSRQIRSYQDCFDFVNVVTTKKHFGDVLDLLPRSVGILFCDESGDFDEPFTWYRMPTKRIALKKTALTQLLTRHDLIKTVGKSSKDAARLSAIELRKLACSKFSKSELRQIAHSALHERLRERWSIFLKHRGQVTHTDDLLLLASRPAKLKPTKVSAGN